MNENVLFSTDQFPLVIEQIHNKKASSIIMSSLIDKQDDNIRCIPIDGFPEVRITLAWNKGSESITGFKTLLKYAKNAFNALPST